MLRPRQSGPSWPKRPPLLTSLTKNPHPPSKKNFWVQSRRLATSFETFTGSVEHTRPEKFPCKATCVQAFFFFENPWSLADAKVLRSKLLRARLQDLKFFGLVTNFYELIKKVNHDSELIFQHFLPIFLYYSFTKHQTNNELVELQDILKDMSILRQWLKTETCIFCD